MTATLLADLLLTLVLSTTLLHVPRDPLFDGMLRAAAQQNATHGGCAALHSPFEWDSLTSLERRALFECYARTQWFNRSDAQPPLSTDCACDTLMRKQWPADWATLDPATLRAMGDCLQWRARMDGLRGLSQLRWLPQDLLSHPLRQYVFGAELVRAFMTVWQWRSDSRAAPDVWLSAEYEAQWAQLGLHTAHYGEVRDAGPARVLDALDAFRLQHGLEDYARWNGVAHQAEAMRWLVAVLAREL